LNEKPKAILLSWGHISRDLVKNMDKDGRNEQAVEKPAANGCMVNFVEQFNVDCQVYDEEGPLDCFVSWRHLGLLKWLVGAYQGILHWEICNWSWVGWCEFEEWVLERK
jgi:hypothetical protein